jgi:hypothetical protein
LPWSVLIQVFGLTVGRGRHVRALNFALKLGTGDRPVICQAMFFLAHDLGASGRRRHPVVPCGALAACALCRASFPRAGGRTPVVLLRRLFALCLATVAIRSLRHA